MNRIALLLWCAASATAESNFAPPVVGMVRDTNRQIRPVYGVAGNFVLRDAIPKEALNWAFAGAGGLIKTDAELLTLDSGGRVTSRDPAPQGDAVLSAGAAFFPGTSELWLLGARPDRKMRVEPYALGVNVVALGVLNGRSVPLAVCRGRRVWLVTIDVTSSAVTSSAVTREALAPGVIGDQGCAGALLWLDGNFLLATARELTIQTAAGDERHLPLAGGVHGKQPELHRAGERWVQVEAAGASPLLILVTGDGEELYHLPAVELRP
jgi:hypothetical protein